MQPNQHRAQVLRIREPLPTLPIVGSKGQAKTFFEVDLARITTDAVPPLPLVFSAAALAAEGTTEQILRDSERYATELGARLRERIHVEIVPTLAVEVANRLQERGLTLDGDGLALAYRVTLRILFRLLFQAYAADRGLLPDKRNPGPDQHSLKGIARRLLATGQDEQVSDGDGTSLWNDLRLVWAAINSGNAERACSGPHRGHGPSQTPMAQNRVGGSGPSGFSAGVRAIG